MDKSRLVAKHKKAQEWERFLSSDIVADNIKSAIRSNLSNYRKLLSAVWEENEESPTLQKDLERYEQALENLNEELRLVPKRNIPCS